MLDEYRNKTTDKNNGNVYQAIKDYKGADTNMKTTDKCWKLYQQLKDKQ